MKRIEMMVGMADKYRLLETKYTEQIARMAQQKIEFVDDISCSWSESDGYVLTTAELADGLLNIPVEQFFDEFGRKRKITAEQFISLTNPADV